MPTEPGVGATVSVRLWMLGLSLIIFCGESGIAWSQATESWVARYDGPGSLEDRAGLLQVDAFGNVYVAGESPGAAGDPDYAVVKYGPDGNLIWVARYNGPGNSSDSPRGISVGQDGSVYVTGSSAGATRSLMASLPRKCKPAYGLKRQAR